LLAVCWEWDKEIWGVGLKVRYLTRSKWGSWLIYCKVS
jgi:hypothetical protein